jgi:hypothetical protein
MIVGNVIKAEVNPWVSLLDDAAGMKMWHHFIFEEDESFILGNGLPNIMRDSQLGPVRRGADGLGQRQRAARLRG